MHLRSSSLALLSAVLALLSPPLAARPQINAIVNAASEIPYPLPGSWIAQGARFLLLGVDLGPDAVIKSDRPVVRLGDVSVRISQRGKEWMAPLLQVSHNRIEAIVPAEVTAGDITVEVIGSRGTSRPARGKLAQRTLGLYSTLERSYGPALAGGFSLGDRITLLGTGLGPTLEPGEIEVFVASQKARVLRVGPSHSEPGVDEIEIRIPQDAPAGCAVPVKARLLGRIPSNTVTLRIEADRDECSTLIGVQEALASGGATGYTLLTRISTEVIWNRSPFQFVTDHLSTGFFVGDRPRGPVGPLLFLPPAGGCASYAYAIDREEAAGDAFFSNHIIEGTREIVIRGKGGERTVKPKSGGSLFANRLGGEVPGEKNGRPLFLNPGEFLITGSKGHDMGSFSASVQAPEQVRCGNCKTGRSISRRRAFRIEWRTDDPDTQVTVTGGNIDRRNGAIAFFLCTAERGRRSMSIPSHVLQALPATPSDNADAFGFLATGTGFDPSPTTFHADGLDFGLVLALNLDMHQVRFR